MRSKDEIKKVSLEYCRTTLKNNEPEEGYEELLRRNDEKVDRELAECNEILEIKYETFEKVVTKFKKSNKNSKQDTNGWTH